MQPAICNKQRLAWDKQSTSICVLVSLEQSFCRISIFGLLVTEKVGKIADAASSARPN